jgi:hypothetical protein
MTERGRLKVARPLGDDFRTLSADVGRKGFEIRSPKFLPWCRLRTPRHFLSLLHLRSSARSIGKLSDAGRAPTDEPLLLSATL